MIDLYTWTTPNGRKISMALEEMGLDYEVHEIDIGKGEQHASEFLKISPNNKIPAIVDRDTGQSIFESGAILIYLSEKTGKLGGDRWQTLEWLMWQMGSQGPMLGQAHHFLKYNPGLSDYAEKRYHDEALRLYGVLDRRLEGREFVTGDYSIADIAIFAWVTRFEYHQIDVSEFPAVHDWYKRLAARSALQRGYDCPRRGLKIPMP